MRRLCLVYVYIFKLNPVKMENTFNLPKENSIKSSSLFRMSGNAFKLMKEGKEKEARNEFPMEYHFINKYLPSSIEELFTLLRIKLQVF